MESNPDPTKQAKEILFLFKKTPQNEIELSLYGHPLLVDPYNKEILLCKIKYSGLSLSRTRKGPRDLFKIERVRDREKLVNLRKTK